VVYINLQAATKRTSPPLELLHGRIIGQFLAASDKLLWSLTRLLSGFNAYSVGGLTNLPAEPGVLAVMRLVNLTVLVSKEVSAYHSKGSEAAPTARGERTKTQASSYCIRVNLARFSRLKYKVLEVVRLVLG
jgi:hypothetical protein